MFDSLLVRWRPRAAMFAPLLATVILASCSAGADSITNPGTTGPSNLPASVDLPTAAVALSGIGATETITAVIRDASGRALASPSVAWSSENPAVVSVTGSGASAAITALSPGATRVRAASGNASAILDVRVLGIRGITLTPSALGVRVGDIQPIRATVDGDAGVPTGLRWATLNPSIATVDAAGMVSGVTVGTTTIRASATADSSVIATATITVNPARTVQLAPGSTAITLWVGDTRSVGADVDVDPTQTRDLAWTSANASVATVSATGAITAVGVGTTIVRVASIADPRAKAELLLTVLPARTVTVSPASLNLALQQQSTLAAAVAIENGLSTVVNWSSSDPTIAAVSSTGVVTGVGFGRATITAVSIADTLRKASATVQVSPTVRSIAVSPSSVASYVGDLDQLFADVITDGPIARTVMWRSSNASVAAVSAAGLVSSVAIGSATITAVSTVDTTIRSTSQITVQAAPSVSISPSQANIGLGEFKTLTGRITGANTGAIWRSSAPTIVSVDASGVVYGQGIGSATITMLSSADTTRRATAVVTVIPIVRSVTVTPASGSGFVGQTLQLSATVSADGNLARSVTWRSSDATIASVSSLGNVSFLSGGTATITAVSTADTTKRGTALLSVGTPQVRSVSLSPATANVSIGQTQQLTATTVADGSLSTAVTYRSSNASVASVSQAGIVSGVALGSSTIMAVSVADTTKRATAAITVVARPVVPVAVTVSPRPINLSPAQTQQLSASVTADVGVSTAVTWTSTASNVATVNGTGFVTALAAGSTLIAATSVADPSKRDTVTVTVSSAQLATSWSSAHLGGALYEDALATVGFGTNSAFVVNLFGDVYRWDGASWTLSTRGANFGGQFLSVHGSSSSNVIAVGTNGIIARFDGNSWTAMSSGSSRQLNDVWVEGSGAAFAVGANGTALRLAGSTWSVMTTGSTQSLNGIWSNSGSAFAVGTSGEVLRFNGSVWTRDVVATAENLYGVAGASTSSVVAVGTTGTVLRFDGTSWTAVNNGITTSDLYAVAGTSANGGRMYITSDVGLLQLDGTTLSSVSTPYTPRLYAVSADASGNVWTSGQRGSVMRLSGGSWTTTNMQPDLLDVWSTSSSSAWAVGEFGFVYRWNGGTWSRQASPTTSTLYTVWGASASEAFAGGDNGTLLHYIGGSWSAMSFPSSATVNAIWGSSPTDVWAVTSGGQVLRYNGSAWSVSTSGSNGLWGVFGIASGEVYALGENGTLLRYNGAGWTNNSPTSSGTLVGLFGTTSSNLLVVGVDASGATGVAYRFNGAQWTSQSVGTSRVLTSAWGPSITDTYVSGDQGTMLRFSGTSWQTMSTGTTDLLWAVTGSPTGAGGAFAVGYNSTMVTGSGVGGFSTAAAIRTAARSNLEPSATARIGIQNHLPLPDGAARSRRKAGARAATMARVPAVTASTLKFRGKQAR